VVPWHALKTIKWRCGAHKIQIVAPNFKKTGFGARFSLQNVARNAKTTQKTGKTGRFYSFGLFFDFWNAFFTKKVSPKQRKCKICA